MIILCIITSIISLLLQGLISNFQNYTLTNLSIFSAVYLLINFVVLQPYFDSSKKNIILIIIFGMIFDITYNNTIILSTFTFIAIFYINKILNIFFPNNLLTINIFSILSMIFYHILIFTFLSILSFDNYNISILLKVIASNIIMTIIYTSIMYYIVSKLYNKLNLKLIRE